MIIYNKKWLANIRLQADVKRHMQQGCISNAEYRAIVQKYPSGFYTPNLFVRAGLFILTCVIVSFGDGLLSLAAAAREGMFESFGWVLFMGALTYTGLELMVKNAHQYQSGVDDALLYICAIQLAVAFGIMMYHNNDNNIYITLSLIFFLLSLYFTLRFADMLMSAVCSLSLLAFIFFGWIRVMPAGMATAPFGMMLMSGVLYWLSYNYGNNKKEYINYYNCLVIAQVIGLVALYAAGNYFIIQTLSHEMMGKTGPVPFGAVFWVWTILMPFVYIAFGIKRKNVVLLRSGLLLITAAALTFRTYYHILPVDVSLTLVGLILLGVVYMVTNYLKIPKHGFTSTEPDEVNLLDHLKVESLIVAETFSHAPAAPATQNTKFGGGDFGGGGSSGTF